MPLYRAYDLNISTDLSLPELLDGDGTPDVSIVRDEISEELLRRHNGGSFITGRFPGVMSFTAEEGRTVRYHPESGMIDDVVRVFLLGLVMSIVLRQRGLLVIHASCVAREGYTVAFAGDCGWGKSTTAEYFLQHGYSLLSDDVTAIDLSAAQPRALSGYPQVKLRPETAERLVDKYEQLPMLHAYSDRRVRGRELHFCRESLPIRCLYLLDSKSAQTNRVVPLPTQRAVIELVQHTRAVEGFRAPEFAARHLQQCAQVVKSVPVRRLERVRELDAMPEIFSVVERHMQEQAGQIVDAVTRRAV